jgi:hypothetical protein
MLLVMGTNIKLPNEDNSDKALIIAQRALEDSVIVQTDKREKPLQPPDNNEIESQPKDNKLPPPIEDNIPYEEEKNDENLEIKIDVDNENEESEEESTIDDKKQINPPAYYLLVGILFHYYLVVAMVFLFYRFEQLHCLLKLAGHLLELCRCCLHLEVLYWFPSLIALYTIRGIL